MDNFLFFIDRLSAWVGKSFAWCILILTGATTYEVFVRYVLRSPTAWAFDVSYIMYGTLFMMAGGYCLSRNGHVRGDFVYRLWPPRIQAAIELTLYFLFFFPGIAALIYGGMSYAAESYSYMPFGIDGLRGEISINSPIGVPVWPLKFVLVAASTIMFLQGIAEAIRCVQCIKSGQWPARVHDVEELETQLTKQYQKELAEKEAKASEEKEMKEVVQ